MKLNTIQPTKVLFVCMGNICRSPTADAVFKYKVKDAGLEKVIYVDSAGTHAYHIGEPPDKRTQKAALQRGYKMHDLRARKIRTSDFSDFDFILAMDYDNLTILQDLCPPEYSHKIALLMQYCRDKKFSFGKEIADPYFGGGQGFEMVLDMVEAASHGLLEHIHNLRRS